MTTLALVPDGSVVVGAGSGEVWVWQPEDGRLLQRYAHNGKVVAVQVTGEGRFVSAAEDGRVMASAPEAAEPVCLHQFPVKVAAMAVADDGTVVAADDGGRIALFRPDGSPVPTPSFALSKQPRSAAVSRDGTAAVCGNYGSVVYRRPDGGVTRWQSGGTVKQRAMPVFRHQQHRDASTLKRPKADHVAIVPTGERIFFFEGRNVWQIDTPVPGGHRLVYTAHKTDRNIIHALALSRDGGMLVSAEKNGLLRAAPMDHAAGAPVLMGRLTGKPVPVIMALSADGRLVAVGAEDGTVWRWVVGAEPVMVHRHDGPVKALAASGDGRVIVSGGGDGMVLRAVHVPTAVASRHVGPVRAVAMSADARAVVSGGEDGRVILHRRDGVEPEILATLPGPVGAVAVDTDAKDAPVVAYPNLRDKTLVRRAAGPAIAIRHTSGVGAIVLARGGAMLISGGLDGRVRRVLFDAEPPRTLNPLPVDERVTALAVDALGRVLTVGTADGTVDRFESGTVDVQAKRRHPDAAVVIAVALTADARATVSLDRHGCLLQGGSVKRLPLAVPPDVAAIRHGGVWAAVATGNRIEVFHNGDPVPVAWLASDAVHSLAWAADAPVLAVGLANGEVLGLEVMDAVP